MLSIQGTNTIHSVSWSRWTLLSTLGHPPVNISTHSCVLLRLINVSHIKLSFFSNVCSFHFCDKKLCFFLVLHESFQEPEKHCSKKCEFHIVYSHCKCWSECKILLNSLCPKLVTQMCIYSFLYRPVLDDSPPSKHNIFTLEISRWTLQHY